MPAVYARFPSNNAITAKFQDGRIVADFPLGSVFLTAQPADVAGWTTLKVNVPNALLTTGAPNPATGASLGPNVTDPATGNAVAGSTLTCQGTDPLIPFCAAASLPFQPVNV